MTKPLVHYDAGAGGGGFLLITKYNINQNIRNRKTAKPG
jgi:hypothetical protein